MVTTTPTVLHQVALAIVAQSVARLPQRYQRDYTLSVYLLSKKISNALSLQRRANISYEFTMLATRF